MFFMLFLKPLPMLPWPCASCNWEEKKPADATDFRGIVLHGSYMDLHGTTWCYHDNHMIGCDRYDRIQLQSSRSHYTTRHQAGYDKQKWNALIQVSETSKTNITVRDKMIKNLGANTPIPRCIQGVGGEFLIMGFFTTFPIISPFHGKLGVNPCRTTRPEGQALHVILTSSRVCKNFSSFSWVKVESLKKSSLTRHPMADGSKLWDILKWFGGVRWVCIEIYQNDRVWTEVAWKKAWNIQAHSQAHRQGDYTDTEIVWIYCMRDRNPIFPVFFWLRPDLRHQHTTPIRFHRIPERPPPAYFPNRSVKTQSNMHRKLKAHPGDSFGKARCTSRIGRNIFLFLEARFSVSVHLTGASGTPHQSQHQWCPIGPTSCHQLLWGWAGILGNESLPFSVRKVSCDFPTNLMSFQVQTSSMATYEHKWTTWSYQPPPKHSPSKGKNVMKSWQNSGEKLLHFWGQEA